MAANATHETPIPFVLKNLIASGAQGSVYLAVRSDVQSEREIAVKTVHLELDIEKRNRQVRRLDKRMRDVLHLSHPNLIRHIQAQFRDDGGVLNIPQYSILMEYCHGGTLHEAAKFNTTPYYIQKWIKEALHGLEYLHNKKIVHRDIKGPNLLMTSRNLDECHVKIGDLGDVHQLLNELTQFNEVSHGKGTFAFMSPEMIAGSVQTTGKAINVGRRTDIWSLGCVVIELLTGTLPKYIKREADGKEITLKSELAVLYFVGSGGSPQIPEDIPRLIRDFIEACIRKDPTERPMATDLLKHAFMQATDVEKWSYPDARPETATEPLEDNPKSYWSSRSLSR